MKFFAHVVEGVVFEVLPEFASFGTGDAAVNVPLAERYTAEFITGLLECPEGTQPGDVLVDGEFQTPAPYEPPPATAAEVLAQRDALLAQAALRIAPLQYAVELKDATDDEKAALKAWKQYSVALNRIEAQTGFPGDVEWPVAPA